ncbi:MAG: two-partner secretion domain-containing protein, partial [Gammaproteobacteria bacterium]
MKRATPAKTKHPRFRLRPFSRALLRSLGRLSKGQVVRQAGWGAFAALPGIALAGPSGEQVTAGNVNFARPNANATHINQTSQSAIVNWSTFSIGGDEFVLIQQPNSSSTILNRVVGSQQSTILGQLQANGRVFLVNPQGVYIGPNASIDVGALTISALDIKDEDFLSGNYVFSGQPERGTIENAGSITTSDGGFVVLAGDYVNNTGIITATLGTVVLAAGEQVTLDIDNDGLVGFAVDKATVAELAGVENLGDIIADGGRVVMTASVANDLVATAVNNVGLIRAHRIDEQGGEIFLSGYGADVGNAGSIDVAGEAGATGGRAVVYGDENVVVEGGSRIIATGSGQSSGGSVRVVANGDLNFKRGAEIDAGDGGFVELSGHQGLNIRGAVNVGQGGALLIDPTILTIQNDSSLPHSSSGGSDGSSYGGFCPTSACVGKGFIESQLDSGADVILVADQEINSSGGPFTIEAISGSSDLGVGDLEMKIGVVGGGGFSCSNFGVCSGGSTFVNDPTGNINLANVNINTLGNFTVTAGISAGNVNVGTIRAANVNITAGSTAGNINIGSATAGGSLSGLSSALLGSGGNGGISAASTDLALTALGGNINVAGNVTLTGDVITDVDIKANVVSGTISINGNVLSNASTGQAIVRLDAGNVNVNGNVRAIGISSAEVRTSANTNINITGTAQANAASGEARVRVEGGGTVRVGSVVAQGTSGDVRLRGASLTFGGVRVVGTSFAELDAFATNNLTANGNVNISEAGGGSAQARFAGNGLVTINGGVNVTAGPGGLARALFGGSEGT